MPNKNSDYYYYFWLKIPRSDTVFKIGVHNDSVERTQNFRKETVVIDLVNKKKVKRW